MNGDYEGPVRLTRKIPFGKRDRATAFAVLQHMVDATPPVVIPWSIHENKVKRLLRHDRILDIGVRELIDLVTRRSSHHHASHQPRLADEDVHRQIYPPEFAPTPVIDDKAVNPAMARALGIPVSMFVRDYEAEFPRPFLKPVPSTAPGT
jgi:hypothetical protein